MISEEEYFQVIESHFLQKRGNPVLLSPKEWGLIREWYDSEIPMDVVIRGIDRAFEGKKDEPDSISSLRYCRRLVKSEYKRYVKSLEGKTTSEANPAAESRNVAEYLQRLCDALMESSKMAVEKGNAGLSRLLDENSTKLKDQILDPFLKDQRNDLQRVEEQLTTMEKEIEQVLLPSISENQMKLLKEEAMRELKTFEGKLDLAVYQEMLRRTLIKAIRKIYNIPRLSLFYM
jgi:hypothetical protein